MFLVPVEQIKALPKKKRKKCMKDEEKFKAHRKINKDSYVSTS